MKPWVSRVWAAFSAGHLTRAKRDVLLRLHEYGDRYSEANRSHATLASRARCSIKTVQRALEAAKDLGLLTWRSGRRQFFRGRWLRQSNTYLLLRQTGQDASPQIDSKKDRCLTKAVDNSVAEQIRALGVILAPGVGSAAFREAIGAG